MPRMIRVHHRDLANRLQSLSIAATCSDLAALVHDYLAYDVDYQMRIMAAIRQLPADACWLDGLYRVCDFLKDENPRFRTDIMVEWATEEM